MYASELAVRAYADGTSASYWMGGRDYVTPSGVRKRIDTVEVDFGALDVIDNGKVEEIVVTS